MTRNNVVRFNTDGTVDDAYKLQTNGPVLAIAVQPDGKFILGGTFSVVAADGATAVQRNAVARMNADGSVDRVFDPNIDGSVSSILVQTDGDVVFGGQFARLAPPGATAPAVRFNVARVNSDSSLDTTFDPSTNGTVVSLVQQSDGKVLIGGFFTVLRPNGAPEAAAVTRKYLARFNVDGTLDAGFDLRLDENPGNVVAALVRAPTNEILVGGAFNTLNNGAIRRDRLARLTADGAYDPTFNADMASATGSVVESLSVDQDGRILAAGTFAVHQRKPKREPHTFQSRRLPRHGVHSDHQWNGFDHGGISDQRLVGRDATKRFCVASGERPAP